MVHHGSAIELDLYPALMENFIKPQMEAPPGLFFLLPEQQLCIVSGASGLNYGCLEIMVTSVFRMMADKVTFLLQQAPLILFTMAISSMAIMDLLWAVTEQFAGTSEPDGNHTVYLSPIIFMASMRMEDRHGLLVQPV
jgi:hypothetical protein